jgi:hypothetical protein
MMRLDQVPGNSTRAFTKTDSRQTWASRVSAKCARSPSSRKTRNSTWQPDVPLEIAARLLLPLDRFEERLDVAPAKAAAALALDDLKEQCRAVLDLGG